MRYQLNRIMGAILIAALVLTMNMSTSVANDSNKATNQPNSEAKSSLVQIAILLDTSGSMKGLIDQARIQIWNVVNELAASSRENQRSELEIAVYQYGTDTVSGSKGYIRQVLNFSGDLDAVSRALFSLNPQGGVELCGEVIRQSCDNLDWSKDAGYRAIFIAGNEAFDQGETSFASVLPRLQEKDIIVNTIYCKWKDAKKREDALWNYSAQLASGSYAMIDHNRKMANLETPYDSEFRMLNRRMNESFVWYGKNGKKHAKNQADQDRNSQQMSNSAFASRMSSKIGHLYKHVHSDLVDAVQHGQIQLDSMPEKLMPESLKAMTSDERKAFMALKISDREQVRREMATLISKRNAWIASSAPKSASDSETWGNVLRSAIRKQLSAAGFQVRSEKDPI